MAQHHVEREMGTYQRGLIDTCLEEGQFDSAILLLEQLRSSIYKPSPSHIWQLIYLALQPIPPPSNKTDVVFYPDGIPSPSKLAKQCTPSGPAILSSRRLLASFAITNSPESLDRALPHVDNNQYNLAFEEELGDSVIGKEAIYIPTSKHCWNFLSEGFMQRQKKQVSLAPNGSKKRGHTSDEEMTEYALKETHPVGEDSWPVLDWLLLLFERDEISTAAAEQVSYSPLLLKQIPCPRNGSGPRWDTEVPLSIIFYALEQSELRRQRMGIRLMTLLINLSSTIHLDLDMFVASVFSRLSASGSEKLSLLFSHLSPSLPVHRFKVALCQKFLAEPISSTVNEQPKVQARAQPRALRAVPLSERVASSTPASGTILPRPSKYTLPRYDQIRHSLELSTAPLRTFVASSLLLRIKFEFLVSYGTLQSEASPLEKDLEWTNMVETKKLREIMHNFFGSGEGEMYKELLESIISTW